MKSWYNVSNIKFYKDTIKPENLPIACSYIWHVNISKYEYWYNNAICVFFRYYIKSHVFSDILAEFTFLKTYSQTFRRIVTTDPHISSQHLACWHTKNCALIRHTICESLGKIEYFRHEYWSIMYENTQKNAIKSKGLP